MGIHSGPKNGDFARYVELLTNGEPGRVTRGKGRHATESLQADVPDVPNGFDGSGDSDPLGGAADIDAARDTRDMLRAEREQQAIRAQQAPSSGALNDMTFGRQPEPSSSQASFPTDPQAPAWQRVNRHPGQNPVALSVQWLVGLFFSMIGYVIVFGGVMMAAVTLLAGSDISAGLFPALFLIAFGVVLIRISKGLRRQAIAPQGIMQPLTTVSSRKT